LAARMIDGIRVEYENMQLGKATGAALMWLLLLPFWLLGWLFGFVWRCCVWVAAAVVAGFKAGRGRRGQGGSA